MESLIPYGSNAQLRCSNPSNTFFFRLSWLARDYIFYWHETTFFYWHATAFFYWHATTFFYWHETTFFFIGHGVTDECTWTDIDVLVTSVRHRLPQLHPSPSPVQASALAVQECLVVGRRELSRCRCGRVSSQTMWSATGTHSIRTWNRWFYVGQTLNYGVVIRLIPFYFKKFNQTRCDECTRTDISLYVLLVSVVTGSDGE